MSKATRRPSILHVVAVLCVVAAVVAGFIFVQRVEGDRALVREASARHLGVKAEHIEIVSMRPNEPCYVAQIIVHEGNEPGYSVAIRKQGPDGVVTRIGGDSLGDRNTVPFFDTDAPNWEPGCPAE